MMKSIKVRVYPDKKQRQLITKWIGAYRWTYNKCIEYYLNKPKDVKVTIKSLRNLFVNESSIDDSNKWLLKTGYNIRDEGCRDFMKALKTIFAKMKKNKNFRFKMTFKSKKDNVQSMSVVKKDWRKIKPSNNDEIKEGCLAMVFSSKLIMEKSGYKHLIDDCIPADSRLIHDRITNKYYLAIPIKFNVNNTNNKGIVSIDPGVRTFASIYDHSNKRIIEYGKGDMQRIARLSKHRDKLISKSSEFKKSNKRRYLSYQRAYTRIQLKITNLIDDAHRLLCKYLCKNYSIILLPKFQTQQMIKIPDNKKRTLSKVSIRQMISWRHYTFQQRLLSKSCEYKDCYVNICTEEYTSITCGNCGNIKHKLGGAKTYNCNKCKISIDRDTNGARNILIKHLK